MKKHKKLLIIILLVILVAAAAISAFLLKKHMRAEAAGAENLVVEFLDGYKAKDPAVTDLTMQAMEGDTFTYEASSAIFAENFKYEIVDAKKVESNLYLVDITASNIDFEKLFTSAFDAFSAQQENADAAVDFETVLNEKITAKDYVTKDFTCSVTVLKFGDDYKLNLDGELANAMTGGMNEYLASLQTQQTQGGE